MTVQIPQAPRGSAWLQPSLIIVVTLAALLFGYESARSLPSGMYPDVDFTRVVVVARAGDLTPEVMQTTVARPLEEALATLPGLSRLRAKIQRSAVELSAQFVAGTEMRRTLQLVESRVGSVRNLLPATTEITVERVTPTALPIVSFNLSGGTDSRQLRDIATFIVRPALTRVPGVGTITVQGGDQRELEVILHPKALAAAHLTPSMIAQRLRDANVVRAVGRVDSAHQVLAVIVASEPTSLGALAALPVGSAASGQLRLDAVADVIEGSADRTTTAAAPSGDVVVVTVSRTAGASAPDVVRGAQAVIAQLLKAGTLPNGVSVETVYDQAQLVDEAMVGVRDAILIGILLSFVVLMLFLRDARAGLVAATAVPITLVVTFGAIRLFGQTLNLMSLGGLAVAIGLVVDDAIVIVEAIVCRIEQGMAPPAAAIHGTRDLFAAVVGTTLTTVLVFAPLWLLSGVIGAFFGALAITLSAAVVLSLLVSVTLVPMLAARFLRARPGSYPRSEPNDTTNVTPDLTADNSTPTGLARVYGRWTRRLVRHRWVSVVVVTLLLAAGVLALEATRTGFLPAMDEGAMVVDFFLPPGTSLAETDAVARRIDRILATTPDVATFTRRTGAEMGPATATQQNRGDILVRLVNRDRRHSVYDVMANVRARIEAEVPEARVDFVQVLQDVLDDLSGNPRPIEVRFFGPDAAILADIAHRAGLRLRDMAALDDLFDGAQGNVAVQRVDVDPVAAARLGISPQRVADDLQASLGGAIVGRVRRGDRTIDVRLRLSDDVRFRPEMLARMPLAYGAGTVPLAAVAHLSQPVGPVVLTRENLSPVVIMTAALGPGVDLAAATNEVGRRLASLILPRGYRMEVGGQLHSALQARADLMGVFGIGCALVLIVLLVQLRSLRLALVVLSSVPLALVGALATLAITGIPLDASSMMGCVLLAGLVVKNGILLLEFAQEEAAKTGDFAEALVHAGERRLRPILMTTAATIAGLLPLAFGIGAGSELQRPLAVATVGGLVLSTVVTLFVVPALALPFRRSARIGAAASAKDSA